MTLLDAAIEYLNAGLSIIALTGKQPNTAFHKRGLLDAISGTVEPHGDHPHDYYGRNNQYDGCPGCGDRKLLREVFEHPKTTGIGIPIPDHLVVVDIDGEDGARQWRSLVGDPDLVPDTAVAKTGRGLHIWFATPAERHSAKLGAKLDLKGVGGYVAAPPSQHFGEDGNPDYVYTWLVPLVVDGAVRGVDWLPVPIEQLLGDMDAVERDDNIDRPVYTLYNLTLHGGEFRLHTEVVPPPIDGLIRAVAEAPEGNRNNILVWAALQARDEGVKLEDALRDLGGAAIQAGLGAREVRTTIRSAYRRSRT